MADIPNIVLIMTDQQRADFTRSEGFALDTTPFIDTLGRSGVRFRHAYTPMPVCTPARCSLFTGRYPKATRVRQNSGADKIVRPSDLVDVLRERGYRINLAGKNHSYLGPKDFDGYAAPYSHIGGPPAGRSDQEAAFDAGLWELNHGVSRQATPFALECQLPFRIVRDAIDLVDQSDGQPFFLWLSFPEPHNPYQAPEPYFSLFPEATVPARVAGPEVAEAKGGSYRWLRRLLESKRPGYDEQWRRYRATYCGMLRLLDDQIQRFTDHLKARGLLANTLLIFCSDHGDYAGDYGLQRKGAGLPECLVRVPLLVTGPGVVRQDAPLPECLSLVDLMPTLCEAVGAPIPYGVQGRSVWPLLTGQDYPRDEFRSAYAELGFGGLPYGSDERPPLHYPYDGPTFDELNSVTQSGNLKMVRMGQWKLLYDVLGHGELYDLVTDPGELHNMIDDPACRDTRLALTEELLRWTIRTEDDLPGARYIPKRAAHNWQALGGEALTPSPLSPRERGEGAGVRASPPNILLITTDQHRFDALGCMGNRAVHTPNIDRLAEQGVLFERCYVTNPVCMPSRASFMTGQFPDAHGVRRNGIPVPDVPHGLARALSAQGLHTGMFGKTHFAPLRRDYATDYQFPDWRGGGDYFGFRERAITHDLKDYLADVPTHTRANPSQPAPERAFMRDDYLDWVQEHYPEAYRLAVREGLPEGQRPLAPELWTSELPAELHQSTWIADRTLAFIDRQHPGPFFAWCSFVDPHHPFNAPRPYSEGASLSAFAPPLWSHEEHMRRSPYHRDRHERGSRPFLEHWREYRAQYYGMLSLIDDQVGRLLQHLVDRGLAEQSLVIFTADHGEMLGDHGLARKGLFHYEPLIRVPLLLRWPGRFAAGSRQSGIVQTVDITATILAAAGIDPASPYQGISLLPWCRGERTDAPRDCALVTNGGEGPHYDPWPELRTLVTERWKLQYYVGEDHLELDDLTADPTELHPLRPREHPDLVRTLLGRLVDAGSTASAWRRQVGRW